MLANLVWFYFLLCFIKFIFNEDDYADEQEVVVNSHLVRLNSRWWVENIGL